MRFSTLDADSYTFTAATLLDKDGESIDVTRNMPIHFLAIINGSGDDRVFRINGGAPFIVKTLSSFTFDLKTNGLIEGKPKVEMDSGTFTNIHIFGY